VKEAVILAFMKCKVAEPLGKMKRTLEAIRQRGVLVMLIP
jgi:hypothetical protein